MDITINGINLPYSSIKLSNEYTKTQSGEIIGGFTTYTISGSVSVSDKDGTSSGSIVMKTLANIRAIGKNAGCVNINIPQYYNGQGKIENVNIEQGNDPSWVNQGSYSVEIKTNISSIPQNSLNITVDDYVKEIDISESIELGEDSHGYIYSGGTFSKSFVRFNNKITVNCSPLCSSSGDPFQKGMSVLKRLVSIGPKHKIFDSYKSWTPCSQSRTLETNSDGTITFTANMILIPKCVSGAKAFVDIIFNNNQTYESKNEKRTISGSVTGLISVPWSDLISISDICNLSKISSAESVFNTIKSSYSDINSWNGLILNALQLPCSSNQSQNNCSNNNQQNMLSCLQPLSSSVTKSRVEGRIDFTFEWGNSESEACKNNNGQKIESYVDIDYPEPIIATHIIPQPRTTESLPSTILQFIHAFKPLKYTFVVNVTTDSDICNTNADCVARNTIDKLKEQYLEDNNRFSIIDHKITRSLTSTSETQIYIETRC